jgi:hypothetical protein
VAPQEYMEVASLSPASIARLREGVDPKKEWFSDSELRNILSVCSCMIQRAAVKCMLGIIQRAKDKGDTQTVVDVRNKLNRFESGFIQI